MNNPTNPKKRLVSKSEYAVNIGKKTAASSFGVGLVVVSVVCILVACIILGVFIALGRSRDWQMIPMAVFLAAVLCYGANYTLRLGIRSLHEARKIDVGVPLTQDNAAELPAPISLVRASQEPPQAQESVLLRAAGADGQEQHEEQLLRASAKRQE